MKKPTITKRIIERVAGIVLVLGVLFCLLPVNYVERGGILSASVLVGIALFYMFIGLTAMALNFERLVLFAMLCSAMVGMIGQFRENRDDVDMNSLEIKEFPLDSEILENKIKALRPVQVVFYTRSTSEDSIALAWMKNRYPYFKSDSTLQPKRLQFSRKHLPGFIDLRQRENR